MFENVGEKIKKLAVILCCLGILGSIIWGISILGVSDRYNDTTVAGITTIVVGILGSIISSYFMYGFGELIVHIISIDNKIKENNVANDISKPLVEDKPSNLPVKKVDEEEAKILAEGGWKCPDCGNLNSKFISNCICGRHKNDK